MKLYYDKMFVLVNSMFYPLRQKVKKIFLPPDVRSYKEVG